MGLYWVSWLNPVVGLGRSVALRSPKGGALRAERRPRPTTTAQRRGKATRVRGDYVLSNLGAKDGQAAASTSRSRPVGERLAPAFPSPASQTRGARQSLSI